MARKLKGTNVARLKKGQKQKMQKTLNRMDKSRKDDSLRLKTKIEIAIEKHTQEIVKLHGYAKSLNDKLESVKDMKLKLEGAIISLKDILNNDTESKSND